VRYYAPGWSAKLDFERFIHRLDHDPIVGRDLAPGEVPTPDPEFNVIADDLNVGEDYAIRVEELDAKVQGRLMDHVTWRMNVWGQRKFGERQSNATAHCFNVLAPLPPGTNPNENACHVLSQRQEIDWVTVEFEPVVAAQFENVTVEYSRTMRSFGQDDEEVFRQYTRFGFQGGVPPTNGVLGPQYAYALVPENMTEIDRLKVKAQLTEENQFYGYLYLGDTENDFRDIERDFGGYDLRLINTSLDDTTLTGYVKMDEEETGLPPFVFDAPPFAPTPVPPNLPYDQLSLRNPVDRKRTRAGIKGSWQPFGDRGPRCSNYGLWDGTSLASGYEYYLLEREDVTFDTALGPFTQPDTTTHQIEFGPSTRWSRSLDTYVRYKVRFIDDPLVGVREFSGRFNTNQPEQVHMTEIGWNWMPASNFITNSQVTFINSWHESEFADFDENSFPIIFNVWYAPTHRLSLSSGYGFFSNYIDQDITLGFTIPSVDPLGLRTETTRWDYEGENHLVYFSANYAWTENVQLVGGLEWNHGSNTFDIPPSPHPGVDWTTVEQVADVIVETTRVTTGIDWQPYCDTNVFVRYILFDWDDISAGLYSGTAHMALAGATRTW
jgi:hypothetical protein